MKSIKKFIFSREYHFMALGMDVAFTAAMIGYGQYALAAAFASMIAWDALCIRNYKRDGICGA